MGRTLVNIIKVVVWGRNIAPVIATMGETGGWERKSNIDAEEAYIRDNEGIWETAVGITAEKSDTDTEMVTKS